MKQMNRTKLLRYITSEIMSYEELEMTNCILWDFMVDVQKLLDWTIDDGGHEIFYIAIRQYGVEAGSKDYVNERCDALGTPICTIEIKKVREPSRCCHFEVIKY